MAGSSEAIKDRCEQIRGTMDGTTSEYAPALSPLFLASPPLLSPPRCAQMRGLAERESGGVEERGLQVPSHGRGAERREGVAGTRRRSCRSGWRSCQGAWR